MSEVQVGVVLPAVIALNVAVTDRSIAVAVICFRSSQICMKLELAQHRFFVSL